MLTVVCAGAIVVGATAASGAPLPAPAVRPDGHWVVNGANSAALHVHGGTAQVDARVDLPPDASGDGSVAVGGGSEGFVAGGDRVWTFDSSTLTVASDAPAAAAEVPVPIEVVGGPYLVYRSAGTVVRLGPPAAVVDAGGPVGPPVRTEAGTVAVHRPDTGAVCGLHRDAMEPDCGITTAAGARGGLSVVGGTVVFVDTGSDAAYRVLFGAGLDGGTPLGADLPDGALLGDQAVGDRLPVVVPGENVLRLVDVGGLEGLRPGGPPVDVPLGEGEFSAPVVGESSIALLDLAGRRLLTFGPDGTRVGETRLPPGSSADDLSRGADGRIYLDEPGGGRVHVVQPGGSTTTVDVGDGTGPAVAAAPPPDQLAPVRPPPPGQRFLPPSDAAALPDAPPAGVPVPVPVPDGGAAGLPPLLPGGAPVPGGPPIAPGPGDVPPGGAPGPGVPAAPTDVLAETPGPVEVSVTWTPVDAQGLPVQYAVSRTDGGGTIVTAQDRVVWTDLTPGTTYAFTVTATTAAGTGPPSAPSNAVTPGGGEPAGVPGPPTGLVAQRANLSGSLMVELLWTAPVGGAPVVGYQVTTAGELGSGTVTVAETDYRDQDNYCAHTVSYEVRSVGAGGATSAPAVANADDPDADCTPESEVLSAVPEADGSVTVEVQCHTFPRSQFGFSDLELLVDGAVDATDDCRVHGSGIEDLHTFTVTGLAPGAHSVQSRTSSGSGPKTSAPVTVTVP